MSFDADVIFYGIAIIHRNRRSCISLSVIKWPEFSELLRIKSVVQACWTQKKMIAMKDKLPLQQIPGIGPSIASDLNGIGTTRVEQLIGKSPQALCDEVCDTTGAIHDHCLSMCLSLRSVLRLNSTA